MQICRFFWATSQSNGSLPSYTLSDKQDERLHLSTSCHNVRNYFDCPVMAEGPNCTVLPVPPVIMMMSLVSGLHFCPEHLFAGPDECFASALTPLPVCLLPFHIAVLQSRNKSSAQAVRLVCMYLRKQKQGIGRLNKYWLQKSIQGRRRPWSKGKKIDQPPD
jgi:hypothetical protein